MVFLHMPLHVPDVGKATLRHAGMPLQPLHHRTASCAEGVHTSCLVEVEGRLHQLRSGVVCW